jgi:DNA-binding NarL/FixJ family response regulator
VVLEMLLKFFTKTSHNPPKHLVLTNRESEIAKYLSQGMTTSWIANELGRKASTISTIKHSIFKKMKVDNILELRTAIYMDYA